MKGKQKEIKLVMWETAIDSPKKVTVINKPAVNNKLINYFQRRRDERKTKANKRTSNLLCGKLSLTPPKRWQ